MIQSKYSLIDEVKMMFESLYKATNQETGEVKLFVDSLSMNMYLLENSDWRGHY